VRAPSFRKASVPPPVIAAFCGILLGAVTFLLAAWLWRHGAAQAATLTAEAALLAALACVSAFAVLDGPTRLHRARVPIGRVLPPAWWPRDDDTVPLLAACVGAPLIVAAGLAVIIFR